MKPDSRMTRRQALAVAALGSAGTLVSGCGRHKKPLDPLSEEALVTSSALSGDPLSAERVHDQKPAFDLVMKEIKLMREFDPGDEDLPTVFRVE